ncbi:ATP-dependent helicase [Sporobolomyces salmoneus]|uniref:ATP-dependent helicase n=1 Tax=Sporobolomyces salmoneus TaxID=183962 RepID=UPI00316E2C2C
MAEVIDLTDSGPLSSLLSGLNKAQNNAVTASHHGGVFVAGVPGCGKTKTLTTRIAWLILYQGLDPARMVVVTFTDKAANEMRERLKKMLGDETTGSLVMGTFHAICAQYLRRYGRLVSLSPNFSILDRDDAASVMKRILSQFPNLPSKTTFKKWTPSRFVDRISHAKSKGLDPDSYRIDREETVNSQEREWIAKIWRAYQNELTRTNAVDFDDLLIYGHELFKKNPHVVERIQTVLVDEFQDTSVTQYEIAKYMSKASNSMTVVGDPDQSIYGWRNAEVENLNRMVNDFKPCRQIFLEENYRSTNSILQFALSVIQQDKKRPNKALYSSFPTGSPVVLHKARDGDDEGHYIASQIQQLSKDLGGLLKYDDFAILLRAGYQSLSIELALQKLGIPSIFRGGHKFFERAEIKDLLSYLQLISNPHHTTAFTRVSNVPRRQFGEKAMNQVLVEAQSKNKSPWEVLTLIADGSKGALSLSAQAKKGVKGFVEVIRRCRRKARKVSVAELITYIIDQIDYKSHLSKTYKDKADDKLLNVEELKNYAVLVKKEGGESKVPPEKAEKDDDEIEIVETAPEKSERSLRSRKEEKKVVKGKGKGKASTAKKGKGKGKGKQVIDVDEGEEEEEESESEDENDQSSDPSTTVSEELDAFLSAASLATDHDTQQASSDGKVPKVIISTVHSAKGLEFPCVFIPGVEDGTFPFYLADTQKKIDEERRLLYVAITRAQTHCVLSWTAKRMAGGTERSKSLSPFISDLSKRLWQSKLPPVTAAMKQEVAQVTRKKVGSNVVKKEEEDQDEEVEIVASTSTSKQKRERTSSSPTSVRKKQKI